MKNKLLVAALALFLCCTVFAQGHWVTVRSSRGNFSFLFPQYTAPYDTLSLLTYSYVMDPDSTISFQVNFIDSVSITGNDELIQYLFTRFDIDNSNKIPISDTGKGGGGGGGGGGCYVDSIEAVLLTYAQMYQLTTEGSIEGFVASDYTPCYIRGKELTIRHPNMTGDAGYYFSFTRYFYWNSKFLAFTVAGPEEKLADLYSYKNALFNSIAIY